MFAVIMAGGSGTRFWPASRERLPKQFLKITGERTLFEETLARVRSLVDDAYIYAVVNALHAELTRQLLGESVVQVLVEPMGCNTAACIGLVMLSIRQHDENAPTIVLPSDHFIGDTERFAYVLRAAAEIARSGAIVTLGVPPTHPETGYGYIEMGGERGRMLNRPYFQVQRFIEKPDHDTALQYFVSGRYLWNSGIFVFTPKTILSEIAQHMPRLYAGLSEIDRARGSAEYAAVLETVYRTFEPISVDHGVMEKTTVPVYVLPADFGWSDVGSWQALYELQSDKLDTQENLLLGEAMVVDARRNLVYSTTGRVAALLGVEDLVIVDTPDVLLIADKKRSQDVRQFSEILKRRGRTELC